MLSLSNILLHNGTYVKFIVCFAVNCLTILTFFILKRFINYIEINTNCKMMATVCVCVYIYYAFPFPGFVFLVHGNRHEILYVRFTILAKTNFCTISFGSTID